MQTFFALLAIGGLLPISESSKVEDQARKLGRREFTAKAWAKATDLERGEMTAAFIEQYDPTSLTNRQIESLLGRPTGYYLQDNSPAYKVGPTTVSSIHSDGYLWVFQASLHDGEIDEVFFVPEVD